jgi:flagellar biosynthesis/type III secretory pathway M-ring protein FliF/YscJ
MGLFYQKKYIIIYIFIIIFPFIKSQNDTFIQEKQLFNEYVFNYNNSVSKLKDVNDKLGGIKYNFIFLIKFNKLKKENKVIEKQISQIYNELNSTICDKNKINKELDALNKTLSKFDKKCNKIVHDYNKFDMTKGNIIKMIKKFLSILIIITIIVFLIVGVISFFIVKKQKRYSRMREDYSQDDSNDNDEDRDFYKLKVKNSQNYSSSREKLGKKKKKHKKRIIKFV